MNIANRNTVWASIVAEELYRSGVKTVCISPGSRSTPLVIAFAELRDRYPICKFWYILTSDRVAFSPWE
jgi:2-succinyl-5-enolpyruvyl-6-hydroxy-3-cyclohexene-1-carboxylate synthase